MKKFLACLCVVCMVFSTGAVTFAASNVERESNNSMQEANRVRLDERMVGVVGEKDKEDWFKFEAPISGGSFFLLDWAWREKFEATLYLYDDRGKLLAEGRQSGDSCRIQDYYIRAGRTYYLKVQHNYGHLSIHPYLLDVKIN